MKFLAKNISFNLCFKKCISTASESRNHDAFKYRHWISFDETLDENKNISVCSFNLLSRHYLWKEVFGYLDQRYTDWDYRFKLINATIKQMSCDIMCFQEMECSVYERFWSQSFPGKNYSSYYIRKSPPLYWKSKPVDQMDGVGIFVNTDKFEVLGEFPINFGEYVAFNQAKFDITTDTLERVVPRNTVALLLKLRDKRNSNIVYVTNTHLYWSPKFNDVKIFQTKLLLNLLRDFMGKDYAKCPRIIMCGDFNSTPNSNVYQLLEKGYIYSRECEEFLMHHYGRKLDNEIINNGLIKNPFNLASSYAPLLDGYETNTNKLRFTSFTKNLTEVLDHIWYSKESLKVNRILSEVDESYIQKLNGFPNQHFPSDHIPLMVDLYYT